MTTEIERVLVCGGRVGSKPAWGFKVLSALALALGGHRLTVIEGEAEGWDRIARNWARSRGHLIMACKPDPRLDGDGDDAPKRRNQRMLDAHAPQACVAFPGGPGTRDMITRASDAGLIMFDVSLDPGPPASFTIWRYNEGEVARIITQGDLT